MRLRFMSTVLFAGILSVSICAQTPVGASAITTRASTQPAILTAADSAKILPPSVFFRGLSAPIQGRNSAGIRFADKLLMLVALVDTSGYSSQVQEKYQAYFITETALEIDGHRLAPGAYGCGFIVNDTFIVQDIGAHDLFTAHSTRDAALHRPMPLQILAAPEGAGSYRLYAGRSYITFHASPSQ